MCCSIRPQIGKEGGKPDLKPAGRRSKQVPLPEQRWQEGRSILSQGPHVHPVSSQGQNASSRKNHAHNYEDQEVMRQGCHKVSRTGQWQVEAIKGTKSGTYEPTEISQMEALTVQEVGCIAGSQTSATFPGFGSEIPVLTNRDKVRISPGCECA
eukprot:3937006-Rhodomonas_salina.3